MDRPFLYQAGFISGKTIVTYVVDIEADPELAEQVILATNELAILNERDKEFVFENKRWFDIVRMQDASGKSLAFSASANYGTAVPIINPAEAHKLLWPVDVTVLNNDPKVKQTPGY